MRFFSLDIETTGLDYQNHQVLEFAMIDSLTKEYIHHYIYHGEIKGDPIAIVMNIDIIKKIGTTKWEDFEKENIIYPGDLISRVFRFISRLVPDTTKSINIAGKNVDFDVNFIARMPGFSLQGSSLGFYQYKTATRKSDPAILYKIDTDEKLPDLKTCCQRAGIDKGKEHSALDDARAVMELLLLKGI